MSMQPTSIAGRMWGPLEGPGLTPDMWDAVVKAAQRCFGAPSPDETKVVVQSPPNEMGGDAVRHEMTTFGGTGAPDMKQSLNRVKIAAQLVASDAPSEGALNGKHALGRNVIPLMNRLRRDADLAGEPGDGDGGLLPERLLKDGVHPANIKQRLQLGKGDLVDSAITSDQDPDMADIPQPARYTDFRHWLGAVLLVPGINQTRIAEVAGVKPQAVNQWYLGKTKPGPKALKKLAQWGVVDHGDLRAITEGEAPPSSRRAKAAVALKRDPEVERLASLLDLLAGDADGLDLARALLQQLVETRRQAASRRSRAS